MTLDGYDGSINIDTRVDTKGFNAGVKSMSGSLNGLSSGLNGMISSLGKLTTALGLAMTVKALVDFAKQSVGIAEQFNSAFEGMGVVLRATGRDVAQAKGFINDFVADGLIPATNATNAYKNMVSRGYDTDQIEKMLTIMKDSAVYGRQAGMTIGEAVERATQGLRMENSMLTDSAGIQKNVAKMWDEYARSIGTTANNLTMAQKRQAEFNGFMAEGGVYAGAAAQYANTYSGRMAQLSAAFYNLRVAVGNSVIPVISAVLPYIKEAVDALTRWFNRIALIMSVLFNVKIAANDTQQAMSGAATATNAAADAQKNLAGATKSAGKAAKGALAAFDELNVLQKKEDPAAAGGGELAPITAPGLPEDIKTPKVNTEETDSALAKLVERVKAFRDRVIKFFEPLKKSLSKLGGALKDLGKAAGEALGVVDWSFLEGILVLMRDGLVFVIEKMLIPAIQWLAEWIKEHKQAFSYIVILLGAIALGFLLLSNPIGIVIAIIGVLLLALGAVARHWDYIKLVALVCWLAIKDAWRSAGDWFGGIGAKIKSALGGAWNWVKDKATGAWDCIKGTWSGAGEWFGGIGEQIKDALGKAGDWIADKWRNVFDGIKGIAANAVNWIIKMLNKLQIKIPAWVPGIGGKEWGLNIPEVDWGSQAAPIPQLATGAVIPPNARFAAILGDQRHGRNLEAPEGLIRQILRDELGAAGYGAESVTVPVSLALDGEIIYSRMEKVKRRRGTSLISGAGA